MLPIVQSVKISAVVNDEYAMVNSMAESITAWISSKIMMEKSANEVIGCLMMHEDFAIVIEIHKCLHKELDWKEALDIHHSLHLHRFK